MNTNRLIEQRDALMRSIMDLRVAMAGAEKALAMVAQDASRDGSGEDPDDRLSMVQCRFDSPDILPKVVEAIDDLDERLRRIEQRVAREDG